MKLAKLTMLSAAALLAGGMSLASAASDNMKAGGTAGASQTANQGKCWDAATNQVRDRSMNKNETTSGAKAPGGVTTGAAPSGAASQKSGAVAPAGMAKC